MAINKLQSQIQNIINLPSLPSITMEIIGMIDDPDINVQALSKAIAKDQVLASKVLKVANSPFFSYPRVISTIDFAITILGFETVKEIVLSASYIGHFKNYKNPTFSTHAFWSHLIASSVICREIAKAVKYPLLGESFISGLIHDIGIFIMSQLFQKEFNILIEELNKGEKGILELENEIYGSTHAEIGSWLLERWNFPPQLVESVKLHHDPTDATINKQLSVILYYSEYLALNHDISPFSIESKISIDPKFLKDISLNEMADIDKIFDDNKEKFEKELEKVKLFL
jgi:HD-like signal output (HDOD) protein